MILVSRPRLRTQNKMRHVKTVIEDQLYAVYTKQTTMYIEYIEHLIQINYG